MNETRFSLRAPRSSKLISLPLVGLAFTTMIVSTGCTGGSDKPADSTIASVDAMERTGEPVLDAVAFTRPNEVLANPTDPSLAEYGELLFNQNDLVRGYVLDGQWCDTVTSGCVTISGDEKVQFGGEPLASFVLDADYRVDTAAIEVVDVRAMHHPVSNQLRVEFDVKPTEVAWGTNYKRVKVTSDNRTVETSLDGPDVAEPGVVTHYEIRPIDEPISGPIKLVVTFSDGVRDGSTVELEIDVNDNAPEIERNEAPFDQTPQAAIFRSPDALVEVKGGSEDGDEVIENLIGAIVDGTDTSDLVAQDSPGALAARVLSYGGRVMKPRRDPTNPTSLCWQTYARGIFCERWHAGVTKGGALTSWSVEGTPIDDLVVTRSSSLPGSSSTLVRAVTTDVVLALTSVANNTSNGFYLTMYDPKVQRDDRVRNALAGEGPYEVLEGRTATGSALIESPDFAFDLMFPQSTGPDGDDLRFDAESDSTEANETDGSTDLGTASTRLASLLQNRRFDDAVSETGPGSSAEAYLRAFASVISETSLGIGDGDEPVGSTRVCLRKSAVVCSTLEVTALDDEGRISAVSVEGVDVADLMIAPQAEANADFTASVDDAILWPKWGIFANWTVKNDSDDDVRIDSLNLVSADGVISEPDRPVFDDIPAHRTVSGVAVFDEETLDGAVEITGSGRDESFSLAVPLSDTYPTSEPTIDLDKRQTDFKTPAGTKVILPGLWTDIYWFDDETGNFAGDGTTLNRVKAVDQGDVKLFAFAPDFSPSDLSADEIVEQLGQVGELTDITEDEIDLGFGEPARVLTASTVDIFPEPSSVVIIPGKADLILIGSDQAGPEVADVLFETTRYVVAQINIAQ